MTGLLVSVRDVEEASIAFECGVDLIDVKEPRRGSLGAASSETLLQIANRFAGRITLSAALGELNELQQTPLPSPLANGFRYAKVGLSECSRIRRWVDRWQTFVRKQPSALDPVAVIYADWKLANAPSPEDVLQAGAKIGCRTVLVDTFDKIQGRLLDKMPLVKTASIVLQAKSLGMKTVLAGSLDNDSIEKIILLEPDFIAVRGAVCLGSREQSINADLVKNLVSRLKRMQVKKSCNYT